MLPRSSVREMKGKSQGPFLPSLKTNPPSPWTLIKTLLLYSCYVGQTMSGFSTTAFRQHTEFRYSSRGGFRAVQEGGDYLADTPTTCDSLQD